MNGQVLVFNTRLTLHDAINFLAEQDIFCTVLWDDIERKFIDLFTIRDALEVVVYLTEQLEYRYASKVHTMSETDSKLIYEFLRSLEETIPESRKCVLSDDSGMEEYRFLLAVLKSMKLCDWAHFASRIVGYRPEILLTKSLKDSLLDACKEMSKRKIHRLAVVETGSRGINLCGIITHDMIMGYIISNMQGDPNVFELPIKELQLDTKKLIIINHKANLLQVLQRMRDNKISFIPIVTDPIPGTDVSPTVNFFSLKDFIKLIHDKWCRDDNKYHMVVYR
jgi:predicted transcriptional regulator